MLLLEESLSSFAKMIYKLLHSDRDVNVAVAGFTGEGKSTFLINLMLEYSRISGVPFSLSRNLTWSRKELLLWIDGEREGVKGVDGLKPGQLPEFSAVLPDELFKMFYRRSWFEEGQIDAITTLNMCRDRHLFIGGNVPNFWDLDASFASRVRFYVFISERGLAWVFQQENNPFTKDSWNVDENKRLFRRFKNPFKCPNFCFSLRFPDLSVELKAEYLSIRNSKRGDALLDNRSERGVRYGDIKKQRDSLIKWLFQLAKENHRKLSNKDVCDVIGISEEAVRKIRQGLS